MIDIIQEKNPTDSTVESLTDSYQRFAKALNAFSDFESFSSALTTALEKDPLFDLAIVETTAQETGDAQEIESAEKLFAMEKVMVPLQQGDPNRQFMQVEGKHTMEPFSAGDLHLLGSLANFISSLLACAQGSSKHQKRAELLQFLIDQLPLGVVCLESDGTVLTGNSLAWRLLKQPQSPSRVADIPELLALRAATEASGEGHLEIDQQLLFVKRGLLAPMKSGTVAVYLIYDLSQERDKLEQQVERIHYRSRCLKKTASFALFQIKGSAGYALNQLRQVIPSQSDCEVFVEPLDAYTAMYLVEGLNQRALRTLLRENDTLSFPASTRMAISELTFPDELDGKAIIEASQRKMQAGKHALKPQFLVLEPYQPAFYSLNMLLNERVSLHPCNNPQGLDESLRSDQFDGAILDLDSTNDDFLQSSLANCLKPEEHSFQLFYLSTRQPSMLAETLQKLPKAPLLCKPFDAQTVFSTIDQQLNFGNG